MVFLDEESERSQPDPMEELFNGGGHDGLLNWSSNLNMDVL